MNNDLISREALKKEVVGMMINKADDLEEVEFEINSALASVCEKIDNAPTVAVNCKDCDGYEAGYSAGLKDTGRPLTALCDEYCKNCPITDKNDCKDCLIPKIRGFIRGQEK